jgi:hypothetical protein
VYPSPLPHTCYMTHPSYSFDLITRIILGEEYRSLSCLSFKVLLVIICFCFE